MQNRTADYIIDEFGLVILIGRYVSLMLYHSFSKKMQDTYNSPSTFKAILHYTWGLHLGNRKRSKMQEKTQLTRIFTQRIVQYRQILSRFSHVG